jgi:uncharacterized protein (TIGR02118 family)
MFTAHVWLKKRDGMSDEEFRAHWLGVHAPIARDGYEHLKGYVVNLATGAPKGQDAPFDGVAELTWDSREDFVADMKSDASRAGSEDLAGFTDGFGMYFVERHAVK